MSARFCIVVAVVATFGCAPAARSHVNGTPAKPRDGAAAVDLPPRSDAPGTSPAGSDAAVEVDVSSAAAADGAAAAPDNHLAADVAEPERTDARVPSTDDAQPDARIADVASAHDVAPSGGPVLTPILQPARALLFGETFDDPTVLRRSWMYGKGDFSITGGVLRGAEIPTDGHDANVVHRQMHRNAVVQVRFKLDGAQRLAIGIVKRDAANMREHVCKVFITPTSLAIVAQTGIGPTTMTFPLASTPVTVAGGRWYTLVMETSGRQLAAQLDTGAKVRGAHDAIDVLKDELGFAISGSSASIDDARIWRTD